MHVQISVLMSFPGKAPTSVTARCNDSTPSFLPPPPFSSSQIPLCRVIRFNIDYTIHFIEEMTPEVGINRSPPLSPGSPLSPRFFLFFFFNLKWLRLAQRPCELTC